MSGRASTAQTAPETWAFLALGTGASAWQALGGVTSGGFELFTIGTDNELTRAARIVWVQEEPDGVIVGLEFTGLSGTQKSAPPPPPSEE